MATFKQFVTELASKDVTISNVDVHEMTKRFGNKVLQMGHLQEDGSMLVPVHCIVEAARSMDIQTLTEAAEIINIDRVVTMLKSAETLVERVGQVRDRQLREAIRRFQDEPDTNKSHAQWKQIEKEVFGVEYCD